MIHYSIVEFIFLSIMKSKSILSSDGNLVDLKRGHKYNLNTGIPAVN